MSEREREREERERENWCILMHWVVPSAHLGSLTLYMGGMPLPLSLVLSLWWSISSGCGHHKVIRGVTAGTAGTADTLGTSRSAGVEHSLRQRVQDKHNTHRAAALLYSRNTVNVKIQYELALTLLFLNNFCQNFSGHSLLRFCGRLTFAP